jgi:hypothetical protein
MLLIKTLSFIRSKDSFTWKEFVNRFHLEAKSMKQLRNYLNLFEKFKLIKTEKDLSGTRFIVRK